MDFPWKAFLLSFIISIGLSFLFSWLGLSSGKYWWLWIFIVLFLVFAIQTLMKKRYFSKEIKTGYHG